MSRVLNIGLIGAGSVSELHAGAYKQLDNARVVAVADTAKELAQGRAAELGAESVYGSAEELLQDERVEAVDICVPPAYHAGIAVMACEASKHVLLEKPMAITLKECDENHSGRETGGDNAHDGPLSAILPSLRQVQEAD